MAFVNEYASKEDIEKYHLDEIYKIYNTNPEMKWTIDRERDVFMVFGANIIHGGPLGIARYLISRQGKITQHYLVRSIDNDKRTIYYRYDRVGKPHPFRSEEEQREWKATLADLKEALKVYKATGAFHHKYNEFENIIFIDF